MRTLSTSFRILRSIGVWAPVNAGSIWAHRLYKIYSSIIVVAACIHIATTILGFLLTARSVTDIANHGCRLLSSIIEFGKILNLLASRKTIIDVLDELETKSFAPRSPEGEAIQDKHKRNVRKITILFCIVINLTITLLISQAVLHDIPLKRIPRRAWYPYDYTYGGMYWFTFSLQIVAVSQLYLMAAGYNTLVCGMFLEISSKLNLLGYRFIHLHEELERKIMNCDDESEDISIIEKDLIADCVISHLRLLNIAERVNSTFSIVIFLQYSVSTGSLCLCIYSISGMDFNDTGFKFTVGYLAIVLSEVFLFCASAHEITLESENVSRSVFAMDWMKFTHSTWKSIIIIGSQSCRPIVFTAGYFVVLSLDSFKSLVKVSYTVYNSLKSMQ